MPSEGVPARIETERLVIRCWAESDAPLLRDAIDRSLEHLRRWMPWAIDEPSSMEETQRRLRGYRDEFEAGEDFTYGLFAPDESEVVGGSGLHRGIGKDGLEMGYWIRADRTARGLATEAAHALTVAGLNAPGIAKIQIHCDPRNTRSRRIPEKLGYRLIETRMGNKVAPNGEPRDTLVFEMRGEGLREL